MQSDRQYRRAVIRYHWPNVPKILNILTVARNLTGMRQILITIGLIAGLGIASPAHAQCYADYKAKQDNPLRLHYGVVQLSGACSRGAARGEIASRIARGGWTLLNVVSVFGPDGLNERKESAGPYFLRF